MLTVQLLVTTVAHILLVISHGHAQGPSFSNTDPKFTMTRNINSGAPKTRGNKYSAVSRRAERVSTMASSRSLCIFLLVVGLVHCAHCFSTDDELLMARFNTNPGAHKTRGNKFALAFMGNQNQQGAAIMHQLALFITTEQESTTFTIQTRFTAVDGWGFLETPPGSGNYSRTEVARKGEFTFINLPSANGGVGPDFSVRTDGQDETVDRTKGLIIETENATHELTVYVLSDEQVSTDAYMAINCVEFPRVRNGYRYFVFSTDNNINPSFQSRFIVTPCEDNTEIMVAPSVAYTHPAWVMPSIPTTNPNVANERQTILGRLFSRFDTVMYNALDDFTGTIITSDKPLSVIVGHQCGTPAGVETCDFLVEQVPPHPTFGYLFFMAPFAVRLSGEIYRIGSVTDGAQVTINCECRDETFTGNNRVALQGSGGVYTATVNQGQYVQCRTPENAQTYCCVQSDPMHPITIMSYTLGHSIDDLSNLPNLPYNPIADPAMVYIPPVSSYLNSYSISTAQYLATPFQGFLSYILPTWIFENSAKDRNRFTVNGQPTIPESYTPISCSVDGADEVCAYGATRFMGRGNFEIGYENIGSGAFWGYAYGFAREASFAYPLAFEMEPVGLAWVVGEDLVVLESATTRTMAFSITRGDRSERTRAFAYTEGGSATAGSDYTAAGVNPDSGGNSNLRYRRDRTTPLNPFTVDILDDDVPEPVEVVQVQLRCEDGENCYSPRSVYTMTIVDDQGFCEDSAHIANGEVTYTLDFEPPFPRRPYGAVATYSCNPGFTLSEGSGQRTCENGVWNGVLPICELEYYVIKINMDVFSFNEKSGSGYVEVDINAALETGHSFNFSLIQVPSYDRKFVNKSAIDLPSSFPFPFNETSVRVPFNITNDLNVLEDLETYKVTLSLNNSALDLLDVRLGTRTMTEVNIMDDDGVTLSVNEVTKTVIENEGFVRLAYSLSQEVNRDVIFDVINIDKTATSGDTGSDYNSSGYTLTIPAGQLEVFAIINITEDNIPEENEFFTNRIERVSPTVVILGDRESTITIVDNDALQDTCYSAPGCNSTEEVPALSVVDCCINQKNGLYYDYGTGCTQCITFGWLQSTYEGEEQSIAHVVQGGYLKGDGELSTVDVFIDLVEDPEATFHPRMADFGGNLLTSSTPISLRRPLFGNTNIPITLAVDNIGQEGIERGILRMRIAEDSEHPPGTFFKRDLTVTIIDTSTVVIGFNLVEYASSEEVLRISSVVRKSEIRMAHPVSLRVQPLTIADALAMGLNIPPVEGNLDIKENNTEERRRIPIRAKAGADYSPNAIDITFAADETGPLDLNRMVNFPITDDNIDEADREYFILYLTLTSTPLPGLELGATVSVGGIDDNDLFEIGFERMNYSYVEPEGFDNLVVDNIYMVKNIETELTYSISFKLLPTTDATRNLDFLAPSDILDFPPTQQRLQVFGVATVLIMEILPDNFTEGVESIQISSDPVDNPPPSYTRPQTLAVTTLFILDADNITVGWERTSFNVSEDVGTFQAFYNVMFPTNTTSITNPFYMRVTTVVGTADEDDYQRIRGNQQEQFITNTMRRASADVTIMTDDVYEGVEEFSLDLFFAQQQSGFFVVPSIATVTIIDATNLTIGFIGPPYQAMETMGPILFKVGVIGDTELTTDVVVSFSTVDGSTLGQFFEGGIAMNGSDYVGQSNVLLTFNATTRSTEVEVELINDSVNETIEAFNGTLALVSNSERVTVSPDNALATIEDDEAGDRMEPGTSQDTPLAQPDLGTVVGSVVAVSVVLITVIGLLIVIVCCVRCYLKRELEIPTMGPESIEFSKVKNTDEDTRYESRRKGSIMFQSQIRGVVSSIPQSLRIPRTHLKMSNTSIGQGEFGIVYKGVLIDWKDTPMQGVAVKALKGLFTLNDVESMVSEIIKMQEFNHPHVLSLIGVCLDTGPGVSMVMPFMTNGSLKDYLKKERSNIELNDDDPDKILEVMRLLLRMCHQIALGMEYLTQQKFIHRDLAARNCMLDSGGCVKVGDFGLAEDVYSVGYFRQDVKRNVKLPYKWMALESLSDSLFSEKTDVWSYGVTMWEIFSGGRNPYPAVDPMSLTQMLKDGRRLDSPLNTACSSEIFAVMSGCWCEDPEERPHFSELCTLMDKHLSMVSDYTELKMVLVEEPEVHEYDLVAEDEPSNEASSQEVPENMQSDL